MDASLRALLDRQGVIDTLITLFVATDARDWQRVAGCFTPTVLFDMSSAGGGPAASLAATQITSAWELGLRPIESVHHQVGNYQVELRGDEADASCYGLAWHYRATRSGRNTRTFVGSYDVHLVRAPDRWRIDRFRFNLKFMDGNARLEEAE
jgi:hypothetical protein